MQELLSLCGINNKELQVRIRKESQSSKHHVVLQVNASEKNRTVSILRNEVKAFGGSKSSSRSVEKLFRNLGTNTFFPFFQHIRWYILVASFVILPLTLTVGFGCRFLNVGFENQDEVESFGAFNVAIYDPQSRASNNFLGCVRPSQYWQEETSYDLGFTVLKIASSFMLAFTFLASIICICVQCFSKHGKTRLWGLMRFAYIGAAASQGVMYTVFISDLCQEDEDSDDDSEFAGFLSFNLGDKKCSPGQSGILGVINFALLFGMVIATFVSMPPRNPVFQCWGGDIEWDDEDSEEGDTSEEDSDRVDVDDSVSLFDRKSLKSMMSVLSDDAASAAEKGLDTKSVSSKSKKSTKSVPSADEKYKVVEETTDGASAKASEKEVEGVVEAVVETVESGPSAAQSENSKKRFSAFASLFRRNKATDKYAVNEEQQIITSEGSLLGRTGLNTMSSAMSSANSACSGATIEITNFVIQLIEMTELEKGGRRVKISNDDNQVEIVDEYPKVPGGVIKTSDSDVAQVRTEFYDLGSRTIKTITHKDGSKTVMTTIVVESGNDSMTITSNLPPPSYPQPKDALVNANSADASIDTPLSSKYQVTKNGSASVTTYQGNGKNREILKQGDLALSVGTRSTKKN